jgi:Pentapeptide repeats (8 copies)
MRLLSWLATPIRWLLRPVTAEPQGAPATSSGAAPPTAEPAYAGELQRAGDRVRDAAKWLLTTFAAVAALLVAGTQFSSIGSLERGLRLDAAIAAGLVALVGAALTIWFLLDVMLVSEVSISELASADADDPLICFLERNPTELAGFASVADLADAYAEARRRSLEEALKYYDLVEADPVDADALAVADRKTEALDGRRDYLQAIVEYVVKLLSYEQLRFRVGGRRRVAMFAGASLAAVGIAVFAWAVNPPKPSAKEAAGLSGVRLMGAQLSRARLRGANLRGAHLERAVLVGADLTGADLTNAVLRGADLSDATMTDVTWKNTICPDGSNSDVHAKGCVENLVRH